MTTTSGTSLDSDFERLLSSSPTTVRTLSWREKMALKDDTVDTEPGRPNIVTFDVAGRLFKVSTDILIANSGWFQLRLSPHYNWTPQRDGTYFIDTDPDLFTHLLAYMRRPEVFPLFYSKTDGFDYNVYNRLEVEATYFQIDALHEWIAAKKYLKAFRVHTHSSVTRDLHNIDQEGFVSDISEERYVIKGSKHVYVCPRQIEVHRKPGDCGRACAQTRGNEPFMYDEEPYVHIVSVKTDFIYDEKVCKAE